MPEMLATWGDWDTATQSDPYPLFADMRSKCPVHQVHLAAAGASCHRRDRGLHPDRLNLTAGARRSFAGPPERPTWALAVRHTRRKSPNSYRPPLGWA
jgi:hypothetical protein